MLANAPRSRDTKWRSIFYQTSSGASNTVPVERVSTDNDSSFRRYFDDDLRTFGVADPSAKARPWRKTPTQPQAAKGMDPSRGRNTASNAASTAKDHAAKEAVCAKGCARVFMNCRGAANSVDNNAQAARSGA